MAKMAYPQFTGKLTLYRLALHDQRSAPLLQAIELQTVRATSLDRERVERPGAHSHGRFRNGSARPSSCPGACSKPRSWYPRRVLRSSHFLSSICATRRDGCRPIRSRPALPMRPQRRTSARSSKSVGSIDRT
jgi:hypothetical protein